MPSAIGLSFVLAAESVRAQEPKYFEAPAGKPHVIFRWDLLARYDHIYHLKRPAPLSNDIERGRFEVRPELDLEFSDRFKIGVRAVGDLGTDRNSDNAVNFDNYRSRGATLERYYVEVKPGQWTLKAGSFGLPLVATEMLWDRDIQVLGLAVAWEVGAGPSKLTFAAGGFSGPQREGDRTRIGAGQVVWRVGDESRFAFEAVGSYWHFEPDRLKASYFRQNHFVLRNGRREYVSRYRILDGIVRLRFPAAGVPVTITLDGLKNFGVEGIATGDGDAFEGSLAIGRVGTPGNWRVFFTYQYIERDAVLGAYNTDDWWFHSWHRGQRFGVTVTILPEVFLEGAAVFQKRLDLPFTINRITLDLVKMF